MPGEFPLWRYLGDPVVSRRMAVGLRAYFTDSKVDAIAALESKGYILGSALATRLDLPMVPVRKSSAKAARMGNDVRSMRARVPDYSGQYPVWACSPAEVKGKRLILVDDTVETGSAIFTSIELVRTCGGEPVAVVTLTPFPCSTECHGCSDLLFLSAVDLLGAP